MTSISSSAKRPDTFMVGMRKFFNEMAKHSRFVTGLLIVVGALAVGAALYFTRNEAQSGQAREALFHAEQALDKELTLITQAVKKEQDAEKPAATKDAKKAAPKTVSPDEIAAFKKLDVDATFPKALQAYRSVINEFPKTRPAFEARLAIGDLYFNHGSPDKAVPSYQEAVSSAPGPRDRALAQYSLAYALEGASKWAEAIQTYQIVANGADIGLKGDALMAIARCYEVQGDKAKASQTYDQILTQMPNSPYAKTAENFKASL